MLHFLSCRPMPKQVSRPRIIHKPLQTYDNDAERPSRHQHAIPAHQQEAANDHSFSFTRERLVPISSKKPSRLKVDPERDLQEQLQAYDDDDDDNDNEERESRHRYEIPEHQEESVDDDSFSFTRERLVPIPSKKTSRPKVDHERGDRQQRTMQHTTTTYTRELSPPPPRSKARAPANYRPPSPRQDVMAHTSRLVSARWRSATTPLRL
ncbi:hypothetical protein MMC28_001444 [Mycoblastus sanguinarius]|nr:hypothetical protein [Mycoblastus sanguinarius]